MAQTQTFPKVVEVKNIVRKEVELRELNEMQRQPYRPYDPHIAHRSKYQEDYKKKNGLPSASLRVDDNLKPGKLILRDTTDGTEYRKNNIPGQSDAKLIDLVLGDELAREGKAGHLKGLGRFHPDLEPASMKGEFLEKPASYVKPKPFDRRFKMQGTTEYDTRYRGHSQPLKIQKDPYNNLTTYSDLSASKVTNYRENHTSKSPQTYLNRSLYDANREAGTNTKAFYQRPTVKGTTVYDRDYNGHAKARGGPDATLNKALHSYYNSYYFEGA